MNDLWKLCELWPGSFGEMNLCRRKKKRIGAQGRIQRIRFPRADTACAKVNAARLLRSAACLTPGVYYRFNLALPGMRHHPRMVLI